MDYTLCSYRVVYVMKYSGMLGKKGRVIVCAIMRKLVHVIFGVLKSGKKYDPNFKPILN